MHISNVKKFLSSQVRTASIDNQGNSRRTDDQGQEEEVGDLDFANFMTLDSVGEDGERKGNLLQFYLSQLPPINSP